VARCGEREVELVSLRNSTLHPPHGIPFHFLPPFTPFQRAGARKGSGHAVGWELGYVATNLTDLPFFNSKLRFLLSRDD